MTTALTTCPTPTASRMAALLHSDRAPSALPYGKAEDFISPKTFNHYDDQIFCNVDTLWTTQNTTAEKLSQFGYLSIYASDITGVTLAAATMSTTVQSYLVPPLVTALGPLGVTAVNLPWIGMGMMAAGAILGLSSLIASIVPEGDAKKIETLHQLLQTDLITVSQLQGIRNTVNNLEKDIKTKSRICQHLGRLFSLTAGAAGLALGVTALYSPWMGLGIMAAGTILGCTSFVAAHVLQNTAGTLSEICQNITDELNEQQTSVSTVDQLITDASHVDFAGDLQYIYTTKADLKELIEDFLFDIWRNANSSMKISNIGTLNVMTPRTIDQQYAWGQIKDILMYLYNPQMSSKNKTHIMSILIEKYHQIAPQYRRDSDPRGADNALWNAFKLFLQRFEFLRDYSGKHHITDSKWIEAIRTLSNAPDDKLSEIQQNIVSDFSEPEDATAYSDEIKSTLNQHSESSKTIKIFLTDRRLLGGCDEKIQYYLLKNLCNYAKGENYSCKTLFSLRSRQKRWGVLKDTLQNILGSEMDSENKQTIFDSILSNRYFSPLHRNDNWNSVTSPFAIFLRSASAVLETTLQNPSKSTGDRIEILKDLRTAFKRNTTPGPQFLFELKAYMKTGFKTTQDIRNKIHDLSQANADLQTLPSEFSFPT